MGDRISIGLLVIRVGMGIFFMIHGWPKLIGGMESWEQLGKSINLIGIDFGYPVWGFLAAFAEFGGGLFLAAGILFLPACLMLIATMTIAAMYHLKAGDGIGGASHAIEAGIVFLGLAITGPGKYGIKFK